MAITEYARGAETRDMLEATKDVVLENIQSAILKGHLDSAERLTAMFVAIESQQHCCRPPMEFGENFEEDFPN